MTLYRIFWNKFSELVEIYLALKSFKGTLMANETRVLGEFCCAIQDVEENNRLLEASKNMVTVFDDQRITVPLFDTNVFFESYSAFANQFRSTNEDVFISLAKGLIENLPPIKVFGLSMIFFPQAVRGIYIYDGWVENGEWHLPDKGEWWDKRVLSH